MSLRAVKTLARKDFILFFKNKFFAVITVLGLVVYVVIYLLMPKSVDDTMGIAIYAKGGVSQALAASLEREDVRIINAKSTDELKNLVRNNEVLAGFYFPGDFQEKAINKETITIQIYTANTIQPELLNALEYIGKEMVYTELGHSLNIESKSEVLGVDLAGKQIPPSRRIIPVLAFLLIITETLGLANLISDEIEKRTIQAVLATPVTVLDIFESKGIVGLTTTLLPSLLFILVTVGFKSFGAILILLIIGSLFTISVGFLIGSIAKDIMSVIAWGALFFIILIIPSVNVIAPGSLTGWVQLIPSSFLVESLNNVINFGKGFKEIWTTLFVLLVSSAVLLTMGTLTLRRRFQ
ncbi:MAG: ABC transporter permease [Caldisericaceae bacterium]